MLWVGYLYCEVVLSQNFSVMEIYSQLKTRLSHPLKFIPLQTCCDSYEYIASGQELSATDWNILPSEFLRLILPLNLRPPSQSTFIRCNFVLFYLRISYLFFNLISTCFFNFFFKLSSLHLCHEILQVFSNVNVNDCHNAS